MYNRLCHNLPTTHQFYHRFLFVNYRINRRFYTPLISFSHSKTNAHKHSDNINYSNNARILDVVKLSEKEIETINYGFWEMKHLIFTGKDTLLRGKRSDLEKIMSESRKNKKKMK